MTENERNNLFVHVFRTVFGVLTPIVHNDRVVAAAAEAAAREVVELSQAYEEQQS